MSSIQPISNNLESQSINLTKNNKIIDLPQDHSQDENAINDNSIIRLGRIADIIFALAMAQCFFAVEFPVTFDHPTNSEAIGFLLTQIKPLISYGLAFIIVAFYWVDNINQFKHYERTDTIHSSLYLLYLMMMFIIPYADTLVIYFPESPLIKICFSINTALIGFLSYLNWNYATYRNKLVAHNLEKKIIIATRWKIAIEPIFSLLTIAVAIINQSWWEYIWFLLPIPYLLNERIFGKS